jgi:uncharacterized protein (DUF58 family)
MSIANRYLDAALVEQLNHMQLAARSVVEGTAVGLHRSQLKGASVEFRQHRAYVAGDEPRRLDWRVLARTNRPFVKEYDEETNLRCLIMLDCSGSMAYGGGTSKPGRGRPGSPIDDSSQRKFDYARKLVAALSYLMLAATESVGVATFAQKLDTYLTPRSGSLQLSRVIDLLDRSTPAGPAAILPSTTQVATRLGRRALVIIVSDFFSRTVDIRDALARLRHDRHELICVRVLHPDEQQFPFKTWSLFKGLEGERGFLCEPALMRKKYLRNFDRHSRELTTLCRSMSADLHVMSTDQPIAGTLTRFLKARAG